MWKIEKSVLFSSKIIIFVIQCAQLAASSKTEIMTEMSLDEWVHIAYFRCIVLCAGGLWNSRMLRMMLRKHFSYHTCHVRNMLARWFTLYWRDSPTNSNKLVYQRNIERRNNDGTSNIELNSTSVGNAQSVRNVVLQRDKYAPTEWIYIISS